MSGDLVEIYLRHERALREALYTKLRLSNAPHYTLADSELLRARVVQVLHTFGNALRRDPSMFVEFFGGLVEERIEEGFSLSELQLALSTLERELWRLCDQEIRERDSLVRALAIVTTMIGRAKDEMARAFLLHIDPATRMAGTSRRRTDGRERVAP